MNMIDRNKYDNLSLRITFESHNLARFRGVKFNVEAIKARGHQMVLSKIIISDHKALSW